jgi:hypothetical protein
LRTDFINFRAIYSAAIINTTFFGGDWEIGRFLNVLSPNPLIPANYQRFCEPAEKLLFGDNNESTYPGPN